MTIRILKSTIAADFEVKVAAFAHDLRNWRAHMLQVEADKKNPDLPDIQRHMAHPRPIAAPEVESAVNEKDEADYEIVDDSPTAEQILRIRKDELLSVVSFEERKAISAVVPFAKARLFNIRENEILRADMENGGILKTAAAAIGLRKSSRSADDIAHLENQAARRAAIAAIERAAAQAHHDIEDLTAETIGTWKMPDFSKASS